MFIKQVIIILIIACFPMHINGADESTWSMIQKLRDKILKNYDNLTMPHANANGTTTVRLGIILRHLSVDEDRQLLILDTWMNMNWIDERTKYNAEDYANIQRVHYGADELWKPDLHLYNNGKSSEFDHHHNTHFMGFSSGELWWVPPTHFESTCRLDLKYWPFDVQKCKVVFGSWTSHGDELDLEFFGNYTTTRHYQNEGSEWEILHAKQKKRVTYYACCKEKYVNMEFELKIKRNSPTFKTVVVVPAVVIPLLLLIQFILPVDHPTRLTIGCLCGILVLIELICLKYLLPKSGSSVPLVVNFYCEMFFLVGITIVVTTFLERLAHPQNPFIAYPPPQLLKRILTGIPATVFCLREHADTVGLSGKMSEDSEVLDTATASNFSHEWLFIAKMADKVGFILLFIVYFFSFISYIAPSH